MTAFALGVPVLAALVNRLLPEPVPGRFPILSFVVAICVASAFGGRSAGLLSVPLAGFLAGFANPPSFDALACGMTLLVGVVLVLTIGSGRDARRRAEQALEARREADEAQRWIAAIVASSEDAIIGQDAGGKILSWNEGAERLFGWTAAEAIGQGASLIVPDRLEEDFDGLFERVRRGERLDHFETKRKRRDGSVREVSLTVSPVRDAEGRVVGLSKIARDVTERTREERERERTREMFLGTLGHDLRSPLQTITLSAQALRASVSPEGTRAVERILSSGRRMSRMIDQLLDVARSRLGGGIPVSPRTADLAQICATLADEWAAGSGRFRIARRGPTDGAWDPDRLGQAIGNLLGNALEHGEKDAPVDIDIEGREGAVAVRVTNRGPQIPDELLPHLFDPFRSGRAAHASRNGLGLGLYIAERIVAAHGGTIAVASRPGETTFTITLPRAGKTTAVAS